MEIIFDNVVTIDKKINQVSLSIKNGLFTAINGVDTCSLVDLLLLNKRPASGSLSVSGIVINALQTLDTAAPFINPREFLSYIQNLLKDIDPNTESIVSDVSIENYLAVLKMKMQAQYEQQGMDPSIVEEIFNPTVEAQKNTPGA